MALPQIARLLGGLFAGGLIGSTIASGIVRGGNEANSIHDEARTQNQNSSAGVTPEAPKTPEELQAEIDKLKNTSVTGDMNFSLVVQGDVTKDSMPKLEKELQNEQTEMETELEVQKAELESVKNSVSEQIQNSAIRL